MIADHTPIVTMTRQQLEALPEYSCSNPTGLRVGKRWKRNQTAFGPRHIGFTVLGIELQIPVLPVWWVAEVHQGPEPMWIVVRWSRVALVEDATSC